MSVPFKKIAPVLVAGALLTTGCAQSDHTVDAETSATAFTDAIRARSETGNRMSSPDSLKELLPNAQYRSPVANGGLFTISDAVIVGHVTRVSPGHAHYWPPDAEDRPPIELAYDDPQAMSRTVHAEVTVTEVIAGQAATDTIVVGFAFGAQMPFEVSAEGLPAMGEVVFFLESDSTVYAHDSAVQYSVVEDGAMLAKVESGGRLTLPAVERGRSEQMVSQTATLQSLRAAAKQPTREVPLDTLTD